MALALALGIALLIGIKNDHLLERAHIVGYCRTYATAADGTEWRECFSGHVSGRPSLKRNNCTDVGRHGANELWHCPATLASDTSRQ
ncbi:MAG: hypothetical protein QOE36_803 [Gaiellaceae bacterium]|nr:hypothetical protein [Gaiellaceae bacterium]